MNSTIYFKQAELLLQILPFFGQEAVFALKGGTAINFFHRNLPRLSVDIDLAYLPVTDRDIALADISQRMKIVTERIISQFPKFEIINKKLTGTKFIIGSIIQSMNVSIKVEPNLVFRGSVYSPTHKELSRSVEEKFEIALGMQTLSFADLYGSKICAALDRQHPRDLFDVHLLVKNEGVTNEIRKAFLVYLVSHPRPIVELLNPNRQDIEPSYNIEFKEMIFEKTYLNDLLLTQEFLIRNLKNLLTEDEKKFLISFKSLKPQWDLLGLNNIDQLPAVKWKLLNLTKMRKTKYQEALTKLKRLLENS